VQVIRDDFYSEALEILELYCNLILTRSGLLDSVKHCHESLQEAVCSVIWAAPRVSVDIKEFAEVTYLAALVAGAALTLAGRSKSSLQHASARSLWMPRSKTRLDKSALA